MEEIPLITALTIYCDCNLGKETYTKQCRMLKSVGCLIFPSWQKVHNLQSSITPEILTLPAPYQGVYFPFLKALELTTVQLFEAELEVETLGANLKLKMKYGFDGSGSHAIYNQKDNADTNNMILTVFCPLNIKDDGDKLIWEEDSPNVAYTQRPLILQLGKEGRDTLEAQGLLNGDIKTMVEDGFPVKDKTVLVDVHTMFDRKAADLYLGCTGAYWDLCTLSKEDCVEHIKRKELFSIDRDVQTMHNIFDDLDDEDGDNKEGS